MKAIIAVLLATISMGLNVMGADDPSERIRTLEALYAAELGEAKTAVTAADDEYRGSLQAYGKDVQNAGNLDGVLAVNKALAELEKEQPLALSADAGVARIQKAYAAKRKAAAAGAAQAVEKVNRTYVAKFKELVTDLTKANKVDDALKVQEMIDSILENARRETAALGGAGGGDLDAEYWRKKALAEFPDLANPNSQLAQKVKARTKELRGSKPGFFNDPKWPYLITSECSEALESAAEVAEKPTGKVSPYQGIFVARDNNSHYLIVVDGSGDVRGLQYLVDTRIISLISGKRVAGRLKTTWTQEFTESPHRMEFDLQQDGTITMAGEYLDRGQQRAHTSYLTRVSDPEKYKKLLETTAGIANTDAKRAIIKELGKAPVLENGKKKAGRD